MGENNESTIMEKLAYLEGTKTSIANAIIAKGQEIDENTTFREYASKIAAIETGGDTSDATASQGDILSGYTAYIATGKVEGTMVNNGPINITPTTSQQVIPVGYTSGGTVAAVTSAIDANIQAGNIKKDVTILGVTGTLETGSPSQAKSCDPSTSQQIIEPDSGYLLSSVTVNAVTHYIDENIIAENIKKDVTILGITGSFEGAEDLSQELAAQTQKIQELEAIIESKAASPNKVEIYSTVQEMEATSAQEGDKALIYTEDTSVNPNVFNFIGFYRYNGNDWIKLSPDISTTELNQAVNQAEDILS